MRWTPELDAQFTGLWNADTSYSVICQIMRIGYGAAKARRAALKLRPLSNRPTSKFFAYGHTTVTPGTKPGTPQRTLVAPAEAKHIGIMELTNRTCRWPIGDPNLPDFSFCGAEKHELAGPYCQHHRSIAYVPARSRVR